MAKSGSKYEAPAVEVVMLGEGDVIVASGSDTKWNPGTGGDLDVKEECPGELGEEITD